MRERRERREEGIFDRTSLIDNYSSIKVCIRSDQQVALSHIYSFFELALLYYRLFYSSTPIQLKLQSNQVSRFGPPL